jgi:7-cyano-7-deazaguanine synthase
MKKNKKAVVLVSGGMDSAVVLAIAKKMGFECHVLTFNYGQRHIVELEASKLQTEKQGAKEHIVFDLNLSLFGGSALTADIDVPKKSSDKEEKDFIPVTYVPARNLVFLSIASSFAESMGARDIFIGVSSVDYSGYPDCRPEFIRSFSEAVNFGTRAADEKEKFTIHAPLINLTKEETVLKGLELGVDFNNTRTCYDPAEDGSPCGKCDACILRAKGFSGAGQIDPLVKGKK